MLKHQFFSANQSHAEFICIGVEYVTSKLLIPKHCLKLIYFALIQPYLTYGILLWGFENKAIFKLQKKAVRIITKSHFLAHTDPIFKREKILKVEDIFNVSCLKLYFKFVNNQLPGNIKKTFLFPSV